MVANIVSQRDVLLSCAAEFMAPAREKVIETGWTWHVPLADEPSLPQTPGLVKGRQHLIE